MSIASDLAKKISDVNRRSTVDYFYLFADEIELLSVDFYDRGCYQVWSFADDSYLFYGFGRVIAATAHQILAAESCANNVHLWAQYINPDDSIPYQNETPDRRFIQSLIVIVDNTRKPFTEPPQ